MAKSKKIVKRPQGGGIQPGTRLVRNRATIAFETAEQYGVTPVEMGYAMMNGTATCLACRGSGEVKYHQSFGILKQPIPPEAKMLPNDPVDCPQCVGRGVMALDAKDQLWLIGKMGDWIHPKVKPIDLEQDKGAKRPRINRFGHDVQMEKIIEAAPKSKREKMREQMAAINRVETEETRGE